MSIKPGEIYFADFGGDSHHRVIILSRESLNKGKYVVAIPLTSTDFENRSKLRECVPFKSGTFGFTKDCVARADQVGVILKSTLQLQEGVIGQLDDMAMRDVIKAVGYVICADCEPDE